MPPSRYKIPELERWINKFIRFIFYYRLIFVLLALVTIVVLSRLAWIHSGPDDKLRNAALVLTGGSIIIGIFYSIINYEHNQTKFRHDVKTSRELLTFSTATKMHEVEMIKHFRTVRSFYTNNKQLFVQKDCLQIDRLLNEDADTRISFVAVFNYFEAIALGIEQGLMDEIFMKEFFKTLFRDVFQFYGPYIEFLRNEFKSPRVFRHCTVLAERWEKEN